MTVVSTNNMILDLAQYADTCMEYHGGQSTMLYAVGSTGALALGTVRPSHTVQCDGDQYDASNYVRVPMTDAEWSRDLVERLLGEVEKALMFCDDDESDEENRHFADLYAIQVECEAWLRANPVE